MTKSNYNHPVYTLHKIIKNDLYLVSDNCHGDKNGFIEESDYFFHSHQCPITVLNSAIYVFDDTGVDPHGVIGFINSIPVNKNTTEALSNIGDINELLKLFSTNGDVPKSYWIENWTKK